MKLSIFFLADLTLAAKTNDTAISTLKNLEKIGSEILSSINLRSTRKQIWIRKFQNNTDRMQKSFTRCGTKNSEANNQIDVIYDNDNPCQAINQLINGYSMWVDRNIATCKGQKKMSHQENRFKKWKDIFNIDLGCKEKDKNELSTTQSTTQSTTLSTSQAVAINPNTHHLCEKRNSWIECSECYTYVHVDDYFYNYETYEEYHGDHTCTYSISTVCDPNFVDAWGHGCDYYAGDSEESSEKCQRGYQWYLNLGVLTDKGFMTGFNCPKCGCDENGPIRPEDFGSLRT